MALARSIQLERAAREAVMRRDRGMACGGYSSPRCSAWRAEVRSLESRVLSGADVSRSGGHGLPWAMLSESSARHAPAARDAERPSAGKGGRKGASASKDRRSERFGFTGATKELPTEAAGHGRAGTAPSSAQELSLITGISASLAIADGSLSLKQSGGLCLPS